MLVPGEQGSALTPAAARVPGRDGSRKAAHSKLFPALAKTSPLLSRSWYQGQGRPAGSGR